MALTAAEKQRRYRERQKAGGPAVHYRRPGDRRSRPQRWRDAAATLIALQEEYAVWHERLPESLHDTALGEKLEAITELDLGEVEDIEPPLGYGRD